MYRAIWITSCLAFFFLGGCIDLDQVPDRECLAERRCGPGEASACGVDGVEYACAAMATCQGVAIDSSGQACQSQPQCEPVTCELYCENGFATDDDGCEICACRDEEPQCTPVACRLHCENGFATGDDGCEICACADEEPQCGDVLCDLACPNGFKRGEDGCEICACREPEGESCQDDPCVAYRCASRRGQCERESVLAASGACPAPHFSFWEPLPQCGCEGADCAPRVCNADDDCLGDDGLCARTPTEDRSGYCVEATCADLIDEYERAADTHNACNDDSDCTYRLPLYNCCSGFAVSQEGVQEMAAIDNFAARTSCGDDWVENCALVDCAVPPASSVACIEGRCRLSR